MAVFLFIDESGHDRKASPYEVLAGISVEDVALWPLILDMHAAETRWFGGRYSDGASELKGTKLLKTKVFRHAALEIGVEEGEIPSLAREALENGGAANAVQLKALALAKLHYVEDVFRLCQKYECKAFASIVEPDALPTSTDGLRKDYAYLFERFFYFLEDRQSRDQGIIVFDELEKSKSHLLVSQAQKYFRESATGRYRASRIVPEPFFVHSDLTTGVQIADLVAYTISWGFRFQALTRPARQELDPFAKLVGSLRTVAVRHRDGNPDFQIWSFAHVRDLRTRLEKEKGNETQSAPKPPLSKLF